VDGFTSNQDQNNTGHSTPLHNEVTFCHLRYVQIDYIYVTLCFHLRYYYLFHERDESSNLTKALDVETEAGGFETEAEAVAPETETEAVYLDTKTEARGSWTILFAAQSSVTTSKYACL